MRTTGRRSPSVLVLVVAALAPARAPAAARAGEIDGVVVFADRARVTRTGTAHCEHGAARVLFERLPASLDTRTLRGEAADGAEVIGLGSELSEQERLVDPGARSLRDDLDKVSAELRAGAARQQALSAELQQLDAYSGVFAATVSEEMRNPAPGTAGWTRTLEALRARRAATQQQSRKQEIAARALGLRADRLRRELGYLEGAATARSTRTATVTVDCHGRAEVTASISYVVPGAGWQPEYDLSFTPGRAGGKTGTGAVRLTVGALVRQSTGEDWQGVRLQLSTARPKLGAEAPQPSPLVVGAGEVRRNKVLVQAQEQRAQLAAGSSTGGAGASAAALDDKGSAFVLTLPHRVSIASDGRPVWAPVDLIQAAGTVKLVATPKLDERVYQIVALKNPAAYPLLEGRVRSYRAGSYVGDAKLRYRGVGEPMEVSLGADEELKVERKTLDEKDQGPGLLGSRKQIARAYRITLANRAAGAESVELRESLPVSKIADVAVELAAARTTTGYQLDAARGFLTWQVPLKAGEQRSIDLGYVIRLPDDWQVPEMR